MNSGVEYEHILSDDEDAGLDGGFLSFPALADDETGEAGLMAGVEVDPSLTEPELREGVLRLPKSTGLTGVSVVERAGGPEINSGEALELPLADYGGSENAVGLLSAVEVVAPYGVDAGSVRQVTLKAGRLIIPRAHGESSVETPGLMVGVVTDPSLTEPALLDGVLRLPIPRGTLGIAYGVEDATGWKESTATWSAVEGSFVEAAACDLSFGNDYARLIMEACSQGGFLNIRLRTS